MVEEKKRTKKIKICKICKNPIKEVVYLNYIGECKTCEMRLFGYEVEELNNK